MTRELEDVLAGIREDAQALRRRGVTGMADALDAVAGEVHRSAEPYLTWLGERDASIYSGRPRAWLRARFYRWVHEGNARVNPVNLRERQYRQCLLPRRSDLEAVRADARRTARGEERGR